MSWIFWLLLALYVSSWPLLPHVLYARKRPAATLAWIWGILLFPLFGAALYLAIGTDRLKRKRLRRRASFNTFLADRRRVRSAAEGVGQVPASDIPLVRLIARLNEVPPSRASDIRLLVNAESFYPALHQRIAEAKHHVHIQFFIWRDDETGRAMLDALVAAARRGVKVRVLLDEMGSVLLSSSYFQPLIDAGGEFSWFLTISPGRHRYLFNLRNHRKLQIIDGRYAFVGGMNLGREYQGLDPNVGPWKDIQLELSGPIAAVLQESFADDWYFATEQKISDDAYFPACEGDAPWTTLTIAGGPDSPSQPVQKSLVALLNHASKRAWLTTGYFVPNDVMLTALQLCAARGVDVRLLIAEKTDHPILLRVGRSYYEDLIPYGVRVFEYSSAVNHAKVGVIDDDWLLVGSANLDNRSMRLNFELSTLARMPREAAALTAVMHEDFARSHEITSENFAQRSRGEKFYEAITRPLSPAL